MNPNIFDALKMNTTSPKSSLAKLGLTSSKTKSIKVMVLGQSGVGKTAMVVRFITRRFIGEYDPNLEKIYTYTTTVDNESVQFDILDAAGQPNETEFVRLETNIKWADAFILTYSVTDKCSFDECNRLRFLINYNKRRRKFTAKEYYLHKRGRGLNPTGKLHDKAVNARIKLRSLKRQLITKGIEDAETFVCDPPNDEILAEVNSEEAEQTIIWLTHNNEPWSEVQTKWTTVFQKRSLDIKTEGLNVLTKWPLFKHSLGHTLDGIADVPVILVGNKTDQWGDRMVSIEEGQRRFREISCVCFHEISVRESVDQVQSVFRDVCRFWRVLSKFPKLKRSTSDVQNGTTMVLSPDSGVSFYQTSSNAILDKTCIEERSDHNEFKDGIDSNILCNSRGVMETPFRSRASTDGTLLSRPRRWRYPPPGCDLPHSNRVERRMSISARGSNASY